MVFEDVDLDDLQEKVRQLEINWNEEHPLWFEIPRIDDGGASGCDASLDE